MGVRHHKVGEELTLAQFEFPSNGLGTVHAVSPTRELGADIGASSITSTATSALRAADDAPA